MSITDGLFVRIDTSAVAPEEGAPAPERLIAGNPVFRTWNIEDRDDRLYAGLWESTPGKWRIEYDEWEYFQIRSGHSVVTKDGGEPVHLKAGDAYTVRPGFKGTWEVIETTLKDYVILL
jgi:uncharacterized protein